MTRVLVVDDSRFIRTVVEDALCAAGYDVETASDGEAAIDAVRAFEPDVVTMDVEMPGVDGIETVDRIMATDPTPIVMLSVHTDDGADASMEALNRGAMAIIDKPDGTDDRSLADLTDELVSTVDELASASTAALALAQTTAAAHRSRTRTRMVTGSSGPVDVTSGSTASMTGGSAIPESSRRALDASESWADASVDLDRSPDTPPTIVIGASTGGPRIVEGIVEALPRALDARILVVQHMPAGFTERFADRLDRRTDYSVREATDSDRLTAGEALVAPGDAHVECVRSTGSGLLVSLSTGSRVHGVRPSIDVTMESVAAAQPAAMVGVVCSGMGRDGASGIQAIHDAGGRTFAQDERTSPVFGIPKQAIATGAVDEIVPAPSLPERIVATVMDGNADCGGAH
ncbi:chemotaxis-specific protein-glutamate methyltransferase CheB [Halovivax cerinus]|uniref:Protein-glutamate methylesterase/protein-glutamine glutaminase n=1 Tax=Halovivax cerinus TaxID=1487865 RepID=A0ABD5NJV5_9EURY|nr:chemotaxis-specific protein-glutamate methyltransferase CheB [Halovivax cerinus]